MTKTPAEQLAQAERDIEDHEHAVRVELVRADRESPTWTPMKLVEFAIARKMSASLLTKLVAIRDDLKRKLR
jgi:hypothetical protein